MVQRWLRAQVAGLKTKISWLSLGPAQTPNILVCLIEDHNAGRKLADAESQTSCWPRWRNINNTLQSAPPSCSSTDWGEQISELSQTVGSSRCRGLLLVGGGDAWQQRHFYWRECLFLSLSWTREGNMAWKKFHVDNELIFSTACCNGKKSSRFILCEHNEFKSPQLQNTAFIPGPSAVNSHRHKPDYTWPTSEVPTVSSSISRSYLCLSMCGSVTAWFILMLYTLYITQVKSVCQSFHWFVAPHITFHCEHLNIPPALLLRSFQWWTK